MNDAPTWQGMFKKIIFITFLSLEGVAIAISPLATILIFALFVLIFVYLWKPRFSLYTCIALAPITTINITHNSPTTLVSNMYPISWVAILFAFISWLVYFLMKAPPKNSGHDNSIYVLPFALWVWAFISLFWSIDVYHGVNIVFNFAMCLLLFFLLTKSISDKESLVSTLRFMAGLGVILAAATLASKYYSFEYIYKLLKDFVFSVSLYSKGGVDGVGQRPGAFSTPMIACNVLGFFIFMNLSLYMKVRRAWGRLLLIACCIFLLLVMVLTASKGGVLAFLAGIFFLIMFYQPLRKHFLSASFMVFAIVVTLYVVTYYFFQDNRLVGSSGSGAVAEASLSIRLEIWQTGFKALANRWIGAGAGGVLAVLDPIPGAHSVYFSVLFDLGLPGIGLFALFFLALFMRIRRAIIICEDLFIVWALYCSCAALIMMLIHSLVDLEYYIAYFWLVIGMSLVLCAIAVNPDLSKSRSCPAQIS